MTRLIVFDLDHTLVIPDIKKDLEHNFLTIDHLKPVKKMMRVFYRASNKIILTNRHPMLQEALQEKFKCPVICRNFCLTKEEMDKVNTSHANLQKFLNQMVKWKTSELNALSQEYKKVVFYDDHARRFSGQSLAKNIEVRLPLHIQDTQLSDFLVKS